MRPRAAITGLGAVSGFGAGVELLWRALLEGRRAMVDRPELAAAGIKAGPVALYPWLPLETLGRATTLALLAAREALADAGDPPRGARFGVTCGTTLGAIDGWLGAVRSGGPAPRRFGYAGPAQAVAEEAHALGPVEVASVACASGNAALGMALDLLRDGTCEVVLAGGVDALCDFVLSGFSCLKALDSAPCRPFDRTRHGLNLGEGAGFLVLESEAHARARGAKIRAFLDGYGLSADAVHMTGPDREGRGAARAMRAALADANLPPGELDYVSAHGTATVFNDLMEAKALTLVLGERRGSTPVSSIKSAVGHTLGAAGALEAITCVRTLETGLIPPTPGLSELDPDIALDVVRGETRALDARTALSTSSGFGGTNAAVLLRRT